MYAHPVLYNVSTHAGTQSHIGAYLQRLTHECTLPSLVPHAHIRAHLHVCKHGYTMSCAMDLGAFAIEILT